MKKQDYEAMANAILEDLGIGFPPTRYASPDEIGARIGLSGDEMTELVAWVVRSALAPYRSAADALPAGALMGLLIGWKMAKADGLREMAT